jgi:hypothetical protein
METIMPNVEIPNWIWLNLIVLALAAGFVAYKLYGAKSEGASTHPETGSARDLPA